MFEPVTITRSTSAVLDTGTGDGFWPDAIDPHRSATPMLAAKATPVEQPLDTNFTNSHQLIGLFVAIRAIRVS
jgi:hypothetical protein